MPNGMYGGVRGKETKVGQKTFVSRPTRYITNGGASIPRFAIQRREATGREEPPATTKKIISGCVSTMERRFPNRHQRPLT